jgi:hypothetical protein
MKRMLWLVLVMILAALLLSACKAQITTSVKKDGSGEVAIEMGFTADEVKTIQSMGGSSDTCGFADQQGQLPPGATTRQEQRGDETWCVATESFTDLDALRTLYKDMSGVTINQLDLVDGKFVYDVTVDLTGGDQTQTTFDISWILVMPGAAGNNNADSTSGSTLTWKLTPGESRTLHAESDLNAGFFGSNWMYIGGGVLLCCLCLLVIIVIVVVVLQVTRRKKQ